MNLPPKGDLDQGIMVGRRHDFTLLRQVQGYCTGLENVGLSSWRQSERTTISVRGLVPGNIEL
jgi:hypothetical protein